jgi:hypothetical protein
MDEYLLVDVLWRPALVVVPHADSERMRFHVYVHERLANHALRPHTPATYQAMAVYVQ